MEAKQRYERVLQFPQLPADQIHAIYIRLASIYLQEENVSVDYCPKFQLNN